MQHNVCQAWVLPLSCLVLSSVLMFADAQTSAFSRSDISGNDIDCGQGGAKCRICGDISSIEASCRANPSCAAFTFDNSCGFLKSAGDPKTYREGYTTFLLVGKTPGTASAPPAAAPASAPATSPAPAAAPPAASPAPSPAPYPSDTMVVSAPQPSPSASTPAPQAASAPSDGSYGVFGPSPGYGWRLGQTGWLFGVPGRRMLREWQPAELQHHAYSLEDARLPVW